MLQDGPTTDFLLTFGVLITAFGLFGVLMCLVARLPIRGPIVDDSLPYQAGAMRLIALCCVPGLALILLSAPAFVVGV